MPTEYEDYLYNREEELKAVGRAGWLHMCGALGRSEANVKEMVRWGNLSGVAYGGL